MKITDWLRKLRPRPQSRPDYRELQEMSEKARHAAGVYNYKELANLIREYRNSDEAVERIALIIAKSEPFISPASATNRYSVEMMDTLADTPFMEKHGSRLSDVAVEDASPIHGLLAMYAFMKDFELGKYSEKNTAEQIIGKLMRQSKYWIIDFGIRQYRNCATLRRIRLCLQGLL